MTEKELLLQKVVNCDIIEGVSFDSQLQWLKLKLVDNIDDQNQICVKLSDISQIRFYLLDLDNLTDGCNVIKSSYDLASNKFFMVCEAFEIEVIFNKIFRTDE